MGGRAYATNLQKALHGLETTDQPEIHAILEGREHHDTAGHEALPVVLPRLLRIGRHLVVLQGFFCRRLRWVLGCDDGCRVDVSQDVDQEEMSLWREGGD